MKISFKSHIFVTVIVTLCAILAISACAQYRSYFGRRPLDQPGTTWISEDCSIVIYVDENQQGYGTITRESNTIHFIFIGGPSIEIELYPLEALDGIMVHSDQRYEKWSGRFIRDDYFVATVEDTTYFSVGEEIAFYRADD